MFWMPYGKPEAYRYVRWQSHWKTSQKYYNQAFVVMKYFGYLRRDPDALYLDWIDILNQSGDARHMVEGFVHSTEYRNKFQR